MKRILFLDTNHPVLLELLRAAGYSCEEAYTESKADVQQRMAGVHAVVIRSRFKLDAAFIAAAPDLRCIARAGAGMENIDVAFAEAHGIHCVHAPEGNRDAVGEHALGMLLALMNNLARANQQVRNGQWIREGNRGYELQGKTIGIIGYGNMGSAFAQRLAGFDVRVLAFDKYKTDFGNALVQEASMQQLEEAADVISLHLPLTDETHHLVNDEFLRRFRKPIWLLNTARGKIVDTAALVNHLQQGTVRGACLDVLEYEQVSFETLTASELPEPFHYLIQADNVLLSPHIAGWTFESHEKIGRVLAEKIVARLH